MAKILRRTPLYEEHTCLLSTHRDVGRHAFPPCVEQNDTSFKRPLYHLTWYFENMVHSFPLWKFKSLVQNGHDLSLRC